MYLLNKYTSWYYLIINKAKTRKVPAELYTELHHIIPKSIGGTNNSENLVRLTAREHYICHRLLPKMTEGIVKRKMSYALWCIINVKNNDQTRYKVTSREYNLIKIAHVKVCKTYRHSDESRQKISIGNKGKIVSANSKQRMSESAIIRGSTNTSSAIKKSKETKLRNGTTKAWNSLDAISKRVETKRKNGNLMNGPIASHTPEVNAKRALSLQKTYQLTNKIGEIFIVKNLKTFCIKNGLNYSVMIRIAKHGTNESFHREWNCIKVT